VQPAVAAHGLVPTDAERLLHPGAGVTLPGALELDARDREAAPLEGPQVRSLDHQVPPQVARVDGTPPEQRADGGEVLGLEQRDVASPPRLWLASRGRPPVTDESDALERLDPVDDLDRPAPGGPEPDPHETPRTGEAGDEAAQVHRASVRSPTVVLLEATLLLLHFDYVSAPAAVAVLRLQRLADEGMLVAFSGLDVLGLDAAIPATLGQLEGIQRAAAAARSVGLELRRPTLRPPTLAAHLVGDLATARGVGASWRERCLRAYWEEDGDLGDDGVLVELADGAGLDPSEVAGLLGDRGCRVRARQRMLASRSRGIGDVPVLEVPGGTFVPADLPDADLRALAAL
jgi:hypothetical protein